MATTNGVKGLKICITGALSKPRKEYEKAIIAAGGELADDVTKNTNILVTNDPNSGSSKLKNAIKFKTIIISEEEFNKILKGDNITNRRKKYVMVRIEKKFYEVDADEKIHPQTIWENFDLFIKGNDSDVSIVPMKEENKNLVPSVLMENIKITDEFYRIWNEYPNEDFNSTMSELVRTIHENCDSEQYKKYLPKNYKSKYFINRGDDEDPEWEADEDLYDERTDGEQLAIRNWIKDMKNSELLEWLKYLVEFFGY
jgi:hypothetical protein